MKITEIDLNIVNAHVDIIAHCCNCFCTMGSGVALAIRQKYPEAYETDCLTESGNKSKLGTISIAHIESPNSRIKYVANLYGQYTYARKEREVNYEAIYRALCILRDFCCGKGLTSIGFPKNMGSGLAGGDWRIIKTMIEVVFESTEMEVVICNYK